MSHPRVPAMMIILVVMATVLAAGSSPRRHPRSQAQACPTRLSSRIRRGSRWPMVNTTLSSRCMRRRKMIGRCGPNAAESQPEVG